MPSPLDLADLPFLRRGARRGGPARGRGRSAGRLDRTAAGSPSSRTPSGSATFPGLVAADASGVSPLLAGVAVALGYAGGVERAGRAGREPGEATALLLVAALAERRRARERRVRVRRRGRPPAVRHAARPRRDRARAVGGDRRARSASPRSRSAAPGPRSPSTPTARAALGLPVARRRLPAAGARGRRGGGRRSPRWGRCSSRRSTCCRPPRRGCSRARSPALLAWSVALAAGRRGSPGSTCALLARPAAGAAGGGARRRSPTRRWPSGPACAARAPGRWRRDRARGRGPRPVRRLRRRARPAIGHVLRRTGTERLRAGPERGRQDHPLPRADGRARAGSAGRSGSPGGRPTWRRPNAPDSTSR